MILPIYLTSGHQDNWGQRVECCHLVTVLGKIQGLRVMTSVLAKTEDQQKSWLGKALGCDGDGHLAATEHEAGIEWVTRHRLGSGRDYGSGREFGFGY